MVAGSDRAVLDKLEIRELIENWVVWRDSGDWARLATLWHEDGRMVTTWCDAGVLEFIGLCKKAWANTSAISGHFLGGTSIEMSGDRAVAQTKMKVTQRALLEGTLVDVTCNGYFFDLLERRDRWGLVLRHPIYDMDRLDPVQPSSMIKLDQKLLDEFPSGYRHLAYLQTVQGLKVNRQLPGRTGAAIDELRAHGRSWLAGARATSA